MLVSHMH